MLSAVNLAIAFAEPNIQMVASVAPVFVLISPAEITPAVPPDCSDVNPPNWEPPICSILLFPINSAPLFSAVKLPPLIHIDVFSLAGGAIFIVGLPPVIITSAPLFTCTVEVVFHCKPSFIISDELNSVYPLISSALTFPDSINVTTVLTALRLNSKLVDFGENWVVLLLFVLPLPNSETTTHKF
ncbi:hypothetical protein [Citrobacter europaeus]|uniref:hypothetical protein n=1 Tax=Citrobacter europaeus TaxID=1914243 RepID=UPI003BB05CBF